MSKRCSLYNFWIEPTDRLNKIAPLFSQQLFCQSASDLRYFQAVREPIVENVAFSGCRYLCHARQPTQRGRVKDAITVTLPRPPLIGRSVRWV